MSPVFDYRHTISECAIKDTQKGEQFRCKRKQLLEWLHGDDLNSIRNQIISMLVDYKIFIAIFELRNFAAEYPSHEVGFNSPVIGLFYKGFVASQGAHIRCLIEKPYKKSGGKDKSVISLPAILEDIKSNINLFTRENYVCFDGQPYDYEKGFIESFQAHIKNGGRIEGGTGTPEMISACKSKSAHIVLDKLSGVKEENRKRDDQLKLELIAKMENELSQCNNIKIYVDKYIAHAATPTSREELTNDQESVNLEKLQKCHKIIFQVANSISAMLNGPNLGGLPHPQFNYLENLDKCWATPAGLERAEREIEKFENEVSKWESHIL